MRIGFYFAPSYGYYSVPRDYWGQRWRVGEYLPSIFWRYSLDDWRTYGLGYPPEGTRWVLVDNHIYLIDEYDGYIIDVIYDAWSW
ncbi:Ni/Co efflux regulator RcnB [Brevundimonas alba]|uniref:Ni/Co efflux regulator RcnB n=1 Tax=Brevundimonas alba TaxID=74314 RepID=A0A7X6BQC6_9CAUL|nr:Ni/Co efflux regulator RcnB [Brevundimonas alba]